MLPVISKLLDRASEIWTVTQLNKVKVKIDNKSYERRVLVSKIQNCKDDNERKALSNIFNQLNRM
jgi:hypothetical protein